MTERMKEILEGYKADCDRWKEKNAHYKDIQPLTTNDVLFIRQVLHPTNRRGSKEFTERLITFICEREITTAEEIYQGLGCSDNPVLNRMKIFQSFGLIRRESKKYYLATPRLMEIYRRYLKRVCS